MGIVPRSLLAIALLMCACAPSPSPARPPPSSISDPSPKSPARGPIEELELELQARPNDGAVLYALAMFSDRAGKVDGALTWLARLDRTPWDAGVDPADFTNAQARAPTRFAELRASIDRRSLIIPSALAVVRVTERDLLPEGMEIDPTTGEYLLSSGRKRKVVRVSKDGQTRDLLASGREGLLATLGLRVDRARGVLWVASAAAPFMERPGDAPAGLSRLHAFDLATNELRARYELAGPSLLNDVAVLPDGRAIVTDSLGDRLYIAGEHLEELLPKGTLSGPNGIVVSEDGTLLYVATWRGIAVVDWRARRAEPLRLPRGATNLSGIDGLYLRGGALVGIQNAVGRPRVVRAPLESDGRGAARIEVIESGSPVVDNPTTGVIIDGAIVFLARRNREAAFRGSVDGAALEDIVLASVPLPR